LERDAENSYLAGDAVHDAPLNQLLGSSIASAGIKPWATSARYASSSKLVYLD
jgi:hypothetical protein